MQSYLKAIVGALVAGLGSLYQALDNGTVTAQEWVAVAIATLASLGVVWGVPNLDPQAKRQDQSVQPPDGGPQHLERGAVDTGLIVLVAVLVVVLLIFFGVNGR